MSTMPAGDPLDFNARLRDALAKARTGGPAGAAAPSSPAPAAAAPAGPASSPALPADEFSRRVASALRRGGEPPAEPPPDAAAPSGGPVGQGDYLVRQGDCMASIAVGSGHFWETLWNLPENAQLKQVRQDPYVLLPLDRVTIPPLRRKDEPIAAEQRHRFRRKGCPEKLILVFREDNQPRANKPYVLTIDGKPTEGATDSAGRVELSIPPNARHGQIRFTDTDEAYELELGHLDPITETTGVQGRLRNLGFFEGEVDGKPSEDLESALRAFQSKNQLQPSGQADPPTREKLQQVYGS